MFTARGIKCCRKERGRGLGFVEITGGVNKRYGAWTTLFREPYPLNTGHFAAPEEIHDTTRQEMSKIYLSWYVNFGQAGGK